MTQKLTSRNKKTLKARMASALDREIKSLSAEFQGILIEDLVTAFESRFSVLSRAQASEIECYVGVGKECTVCSSSKSGLRSVTY